MNDSTATTHRQHTLADNAVISAAEGFHAERRFVTTGMLDPIGLHDSAVDHDLCSADFSDPTCGRMFEMILAIAKTGQRMLPAEIARYCEDQGLPIARQIWSDLLGEVLAGDASEIPELATSVADWRDRRNKSQELLRESVEILSSDRPRVGVPEDTPPEWATIAQVMASEPYTKGMESVTTGFSTLDRALGGGFRRGTMNIIAGRTGSAKSTLALKVARVAAFDGVCSLVLKLEESIHEAVWRMHAAQALVPLSRFLEGEQFIFAEDDLRASEAKTMLVDLPVRFSAARGLCAIRRAIQDHADDDGRLVIIDQLSMVEVPEIESPYQRATIVSNALREMAVNLDVAIVAVSQVNREAAKRTNPKKTTMAPLTCNDLRESGHLEADAAVVLAIHGATEHDATRGRRMDSTVREYILECGLVKNRYGRMTPGDEPLALRWRPTFARIDDRLRPATAGSGHEV